LSVPIQFGVTVSFHIIFPAITIGLASYLAVLEGLRLSDAVYRDLYRFWSKIFAAHSPAANGFHQTHTCRECSLVSLWFLPLLRPIVRKSLEDLVKVGLAEKTSVKYGNNTKTLLRRRDAQIVGQTSVSGPANLVNLA
jgi:hypothetical protein